MNEDTSPNPELSDEGESEVLFKKRSKEVGKSLSLFTGFFILSKIAYDIQENVYGRVNAYRKTSEALGNPDYLTSFAYPLALLFAIRTFLKTALLLNEQTGQRPGSFILEMNKFFLKWAPVFVWSLNIWHEVSNRPSYQDNMMSDILAGSLAVGIYYAYNWTTRVKEKRKKTEKST